MNVPHQDLTNRGAGTGCVRRLLPMKPAPGTRRPQRARPVWPALRRRTPDPGIRSIPCCLRTPERRGEEVLELVPLPGGLRNRAVARPEQPGCFEAGRSLAASSKAKVDARCRLHARVVRFRSPRWLGLAGCGCQLGWGLPSAAGGCGMSAGGGDPAGAIAGGDS